MVKLPISLRSFIFFIVLLLFSDAVAQDANNRNRNWYWAGGAGLRFNPNGAALAGSAVESGEGTVTMSDLNGNLLFYTDGASVWNSNHQVRATGLGSAVSAVQRVVAVPVPCSPSRYYIVTNGRDGVSASGPLRYCVYDVAGAGGQGALSTPVTQLFAHGPNSTEKLIAVPHSNGLDYWIIYPGDQNYIRAIPATNSGVLTAASTVVSTSTFDLRGGGDNVSLGEFKSSAPDAVNNPGPNRTWLVGVSFANRVSILEFNRTTGNVTSRHNFTIGGGVTQTYGCAISPNGRYVFVSNLANGQIRRYDLTNANPLGTEQVFTPPGLSVGAAMQIGPDGRLYVSGIGVGSVIVIQNPNNAATGGYTYSTITGVNSMGYGVLNQPLLPHACPDLITSQPVNRTITTCPGNTTFSVTANACTFQWQVSTNGGSTWTNVTNNTTYSGATTATLTLTNIPATYNNYRYRVIASTAPSGSCTTTSNAVTLTVNCGCPAVTGTPTISGTATFCAGANTTLTGNVPAGNNGYYYQWYNVTTNTSLSTGTISTAAATTINSPAITTAGTYRFRLANVAGNINDADCYKQASQVVTVTALPNITTQPTDRTICAGTNTTFAIVATGATLGYQWEVSTNSGTTWLNVTNGGVYSGATSSTLTITGATVALNNNRYRVLITTGGTCLVTSEVRTLTVNPIPATPTATSNGPVCVGGDLNLSTDDVSGATYAWTGPGTYTSTDRNPSRTPVTVAMAGDYQVRITVNGCESTQSTPLTVTVNAPIAITTQPEAIGGCVGSSTALNVVATGTAPITYAWEKLSPTTSVGTNNATLPFASLTAGDAGDYRVIVSNSCGPVTSATATVAITLNETPSVSLAVDNDKICDGTSITLTATPSGGGLIPAYTFTETTLGTIGTASQTANTVSTPLANTTDAVITRTFTVSMLSNSSCIAGGAANPVTATVTVDIDPQASTANIIQNDQTICVDNIALSADPIATDHTGTWSKISATGSSAIDNNGAVSNLDISESSTFRYTVESPLKLCDEKTDEVTITRAGNLTDPSPVSAQSATQCETATAPTLNGVTLQIGEGETGTWSATAPATIDANGQTGNLQVGANTFTYTIANPSSGCDPQTADVVITIDEQPVITNPSLSAVCAPSTVNITTIVTPSSSTITYHEGTGGTGAEVANQETVAISGNYSIRAVNGTCSAFQDVVVEVNPTPAFTVTQPSAQCEGIFDLSTAVSGITPAGATLSYHTSLTGGTEVTNNVTSSDTYYVQATASGCPSTRQPITVRIDTQPTNVSLADPTIITCNSSINLNAASPSPSTAVGEWVIMSQPVTQTASLTAQNDPISQINGLILGQTTLEWRVRNGTCIANPLTLTIDQVGNITDATIAIEGTEITENFDMCINNSVQVVGSAVASDETGTWTRHFTGNNPTQTFESTAVGTTTLTWSIEKTSLSGCPRSEKTITINTYDSPSEEFRANRNAICEENQVDIILYPNYVAGDLNYSWSRIDEDGNVFPVAIRDTIVLNRPSQSGLYQLTTTHRVCNTVTTQTQYIKIYEQPRLQVQEYMTIEVREGVSGQIEVISTGLNRDTLTSIIWEGNYLDNINSLEPFIIPTDRFDGLLEYQLSVTTGIGEARCYDQVGIKIMFKLPIKIPNAFSPNGDNINDVWAIQGMGAYPDAVMRIYNRWGNMIFEQFGGYTKPWDGTNRNGAEMAIGTYYYILDLNDEERTVKTGDVTILR